MIKLTRSPFTKVPFSTIKAACHIIKNSAPNITKTIKEAKSPLIVAAFKAKLTTLFKWLAYLFNSNHSLVKAFTVRIFCMVSSTTTLVWANSSWRSFVNFLICFPKYMAAKTTKGKVPSIMRANRGIAKTIKRIPPTRIIICLKNSATVVAKAPWIWVTSFVILLVSSPTLCSSIQGIGREIIFLNKSLLKVAMLFSLTMANNLILK